MPINLQSILEGLTQLNPTAAAQLAQRKSAAETLRSRLFNESMAMRDQDRYDQMQKLNETREARLARIDDENRAAQADARNRQATLDAQNLEQRNYENARQANEDITLGKTVPVASQITLPQLGAPSTDTDENGIPYQTKQNPLLQQSTLPSPDAMLHPEWDVHGIPGQGDRRVRSATPEEYAARQADIAAQTAKTQQKSQIDLQNTKRQADLQNVTDFFNTPYGKQLAQDPNNVNAAYMHAAFGITPKPETLEGMAMAALKTANDPNSTAAQVAAANKMYDRIYPAKDTSAADDRRADLSYRFHAGELDKLETPISQLATRFSRLQDALAQNTPQADALIAPELLSVMAGGAGSGLRMNEAEIARIVGGRSHWEDLKAAANRWSLDPKSATSITPEQRREIRVLVDEVGRKVQQRQQILNSARSRLSGSDDPAEHRKILAGAHQALTDVDIPPQTTTVSTTPPPGITPPPPIPRPQKPGQKIDAATIKKIYDLVGGDPKKADEFARQAGWDTSK